MPTPRLTLPAIAAALLVLPACATRPYTSPVEVTRFVAPDPAALGRGTIAIAFPEDSGVPGMRAAFTNAVSAELARLGYTVVAEGTGANQTVQVRAARSPVSQQFADRGRGGVNVGVGGGVGTGGWGGGFGGVGVGIDLGSLGGRRENANALTELSVRIAGAGGAPLWEGRAQMATGAKSPYAQVDSAARTLASALFRDFPGGNGETVTIDVAKLQGTR